MIVPPLLKVNQFNLFFQDTTDFVAYVAKDPVNRRGGNGSLLCYSMQLAC